MVIWGTFAFAVSLYFHFIPNSGTDVAVQNEPKPLVTYTYSPEQMQEVREYFEGKVRHGFNGVVLLGQKDSVFMSMALGYANFQTGDTLSTASAFQLASVSKQFTAVAILQLYQQGLLNLTDSVTRFFPEFPYPDITIHQLLTHRSGIPNYLYFFRHIPANSDSLLTNTAVINELVAHKPQPYFNANRRHHYSNTGYAVLAAIVEKVSQKSFNRYVNDNIFKPLGMTQSYTYRDKPFINDTNGTLGYIYKWKRADDNFFDGVLGDKGIYCSATDLFKWDQGLYKNRIIDTTILQIAFQPMGKPQSFDNNYGYGWRMFHYGSDSIRVIYHGGWWHGYKTLLVRIPQDETTIVVLKNRSSGAKISTKQLLNILYPNAIQTTDTLGFDVED